MSSGFRAAYEHYGVEFAVGTRHGRYSALVTRSALIEGGDAPDWWLGPSRHPWHRAARLFDAGVTVYLEVDELDVELGERDVVDDHLVDAWLDFATTRILAATLADRELVDALLARVGERRRFWNGELERRQAGIPATRTSEPTIAIELEVAQMGLFS